MNRKNKDIAGFQILNILAEVDGSFDPKEGQVIIDYIIQNFPFGGNLEEAVVTYDFGNGLSVSAGKMLSYMGFEAYDPTNMYSTVMPMISGFKTIQVLK